MLQVHHLVIKSNLNLDHQSTIRVKTLEVQFFKDQIICHLKSKASTDHQVFEAVMKYLETT